MKPLPDTYDKEGFTHRVLERDGQVALIEKRTKPENRVIGYEVIVIQSHEGYDVMGRVVPPSEFPPRSEEWGTYGFSFNRHDLEGARKKLSKLAKAVKKEARQKS